MIFSNPIILASEFITQVVIIVLIGIEIVVYVHNHGLKKVEDYTKLKVFNLVVTITALGALWLLAEVFISFGEIYFIFARFVIIVVIIAIVVYQSFLSHQHREIKYSSPAVWFALLASIFVVLDMLYTYIPTPLTGIVYSLSRIAAILAYYFLIMSYLVKINHEQQ